MSHTSPATYLVWSIITSLLGVFLIFHLWSFDRFKCLKWNSGPYSGAFKRVMTYSYLLGIPLVVTYAVGNTIIKYHEGFMQVPFLGIVTKPYTFWGLDEQRCIFPLTLCFSVAWSLEMVTHLEELCFWLYLVNSTSRNQDWFKTLYFKTWVIGSAVAVMYMPLLTIFTRGDPIKNEAYTFLAGSLGSLSLTLWFLPVLYMFPTFLKNLKSEGVDIGTIVRLTKFEELNRIRIIFRFLFCVPLLILGVDGVRPHDHRINESMLLTDLFCVLAGFGFAVSSGITLVIFFPRSIEGEIAAKDAERDRKRSRTGRSTFGLESRPSRMDTYMSETYSFSQQPSSIHGRDKQYFGNNRTAHYLTSSPKGNFHPSIQDVPLFDDDSQLGHGGKSMEGPWKDEERDVAAPLPPMRPNRRRGTEVELGGIESLTETNLSVHNLRMSNLNPLVHGFTSPINLGYTAEPETYTMPKYTFKK
ncbi:hypothetical protein P691DRAFT_808025 [Macrolepiota fuliginosa MF-IS2]|uniref:Uncharacterized protein n=1 Tax=Macrolepiota fuliginosa MF-IS2 TaxID=1400762 RepID=A0A9P6BZV8_9AGAR|nr:hypothetical protein P691DRAFT_808025 [Macrolepiota fuliginosa MF-IS2]